VCPLGRRPLTVSRQIVSQQTIWKLVYLKDCRANDKWPSEQVRHRRGQWWRGVRHQAAVNLSRQSS
jgi:hypothetical protein